MDSTFEIIRFHFTGPMHLSNARSDYARSEKMIRSDTLAAAIMQTWAVLNREEWITISPGFVTSSLFPFTLVGNEFKYFFPKPVKDQARNKLPAELLKKFRKVKFYEKCFFEKRLEDYLEVNQEDIREDLLTRIPDSDNYSFYKSTVIPRIMKPRNNVDDTSIFHMERREFKPGAGLFCLVKYLSPEDKKKFLTGLSLLAENGLGSDRTVGYGRFTFKEDSISFSLPQSSGYMINLSLYLPESEIDLTNSIGPWSRYDLVRRGGWISEPFNSLRKRNVHMFGEGSVLMMQGNELTVKGRVADVKPKDLPTHHAIYRSGKSIFLPIKI
jgi:CRISPR-associated protein Csm4